MCWRQSRYQLSALVSTAQPLSKYQHSALNVSIPCSKQQELFLYGIKFQCKNGINFLTHLDNFMIKVRKYNSMIKARIQNSMMKARWHNWWCKNWWNSMESSVVPVGGGCLRGWICQILTVICLPLDTLRGQHLEASPGQSRHLLPGSLRLHAQPISSVVAQATESIQQVHQPRPHQAFLLSPAY